MSTPNNIPPTTVHYAVTAAYHHDTLPRVLALFARHNIIPDLVKASHYKMGDKSGTFQDERFTIDIHVSGLTAAFQQVLLEKLLTQPMVHSVREEILFQKAFFSQKDGAKLAS